MAEDDQGHVTLGELARAWAETAYRGAGQREISWLRGETEFGEIFQNPSREDAREVAQLQNQSISDDRIVQVFEIDSEGNVPEREDERFTWRSIDQSLTNLYDTLSRMTGDTNHKVAWVNNKTLFQKSDPTTQRLADPLFIVDPRWLYTLPEVGPPNTTTVYPENSEGAWYYHAAYKFLLGVPPSSPIGMSGIRPRAKNSLLYHDLFGASWNLNEINTWRTEHAGDQAEVLTSAINAIDAALSETSESELGQFIKNKINTQLANQEYGSNITANYSQLHSISRAVVSYFSENPDLDTASEIESKLLSFARENYKFLYYASIIGRGLTSDQLAADAPLGVEDSTAAVLFSFNTLPEGMRGANQSLPHSQRGIPDITSLDQYIELFTDIIYRVRLHEAIKEYDQELISQIQNDPASVEDILDDNGLYRDPEAAKRRINEIIGEEWGERSDPQDSAHKRLAEQCFLIDFLQEFSTLNQERAVQYKTFIPVQGATDTLVNKLVYNPGIAIMDTLKPAEISSLVPKIRIFKIVYDDALSGNFLQPVELEIPFYSFPQQEELESLTRTTRERGQGAGITSFDWLLDGQNPFAARRNITAKLKLHFQSMEAFLDPIPQGLQVTGRPDQRRDFRYVDLVNIAVAMRNADNSWNPEYYKLKVEVGWTVSDLDVLIGTEQEKRLKKKAIEQANMVMHLGAVEHDININDQGNVDLEIQYIAYQEAAYIDADSDILADTQMRVQRRLLREKIREIKRDDPCDTRRINALKTEYREFIRTQNNRAHRRILEELMANDNIFYMPVPMSKIQQYYSAIAREAGGTSVRGLRRELFGGSSSNFTAADMKLVIREHGSQAAGTYDSQVQRAQRSGPSDGETVDRLLKDLQYGDGEGGNVNIQYFFFGDLIDVALKYVSQGNEVSDSEGNPIATVPGKLEKNLKILMGPITFEAQINGESVPIYNINLADIPISVHYFIEWFMKAVISKNRTTYPALLFIRDTLSQIIQSAIRRQCRGMENIQRQSLQLRTNFFTGGEAGGAAGLDPMDVMKNIVPHGRQEQPPNTRVDVDEEFRKRNQRSGRARRLLPPPRDGEQGYNYMLIFSINTAALEIENGNYDEDQARGVYHFGIGKDAGLLKSIKFNRMDLPGLREARFEREFLEESQGLAILANRYSITITTVGNTLFWPGSKIYVNPSGLGQIGDPTSARSAARVLGIGGYHRVYAVESYIESGKYETTIKALWESSGEAETPGPISTTPRCNRQPNVIDSLAAFKE